MSARRLGPFETGSEAMLAVRREDGSFTGAAVLFDLLKETLQEAGVELGRWDWRIVRWLAAWDVQTVAAVAGWVGRASDRSVEPEQREALAEEDQGAEDRRRLGEIRGVLAGFDWEHDDRQYALEQIERIAEGGQP